MSDPVELSLIAGTLVLTGAALAHQVKKDKQDRKRAKKAAKKLEEVRQAANSVKEKVLAAHAQGMIDEKDRNK